MSILYIATRTALLLGALISIDARATDPCRQLATMAAESAVQLPDSELARATLSTAMAKSLTLDRFAADYDLPELSGSYTAAHAIMLVNQQLQIGHLQSAGASVAIAAPGLSAVRLSSGERHFIAPLGNGQLLAQDGRALNLNLDLKAAGAYTFTIPSGASFSVDRDRRVTLATGTPLALNLGRATPSALTLPQPAELVETTAPDSPVLLEILSPPKLLPGGQARIQIRAPAVDFRLVPLSLCFSTQRDDTQVSASASPHFLAQNGDIATYEVRVPEALAFGSGTTAQILNGRAFTVRAFGRINGKPFADTTASGVLSHRGAGSAVGLAILAALLLLACAMTGQTNPFAVVSLMVRNSGGKYSLSNVQILGWTALVLFSMGFIYTTTGTLLVITTDMLALLGIAGATSVLARSADNASGGAVAASAEQPYFVDLLQSNGRFDLLRFQMLGFTIVTWLYTLINVLQTQGFPEIPSNLYLLMGVSNGTYVLGKLPAVSGAAAPSPTALEIMAIQRALKVPVTGNLDQATSDAIIQYKQQNSIVPATGTYDSRLRDKLLR